MRQSKITLVIAAVVGLLVSGCGLHGPNITVEFNIDKRDQRDGWGAEVVDQEPVLSPEEVQDLISYAGVAVDLVRKIEEEMRVSRMLREAVARDLFSISIDMLSTVDPETNHQQTTKQDASDPIFE